MDEAAELLRVLNELGYAWVEGPLTPEPESTQLQRYVQLMKGPRVRIQPEGSGRIGDLTDFATIKRWATAGAADQFSTDCYYRDGITPIVRLLAWVRARPRLNLTINLHWSWLPHVHLAMACDDAEYPCVEVPAAAEYPSALYAGSPFVRAPDWPGIYLLRAAAPA
jgi:L-alanine-DL-glutamate epimerase-like enolase superfamily enzyme